MKVSLCLLICIAAVATFSRLLFIDSSPPGFFVDEAGGAVNAICVSETGKGELGDKFPIFFAAFDRAGAFYTAPYIYPLAGWLSVFGKTTVEVRSFVAFCSILTILGLFLIGDILVNRRAAWLIALTASLSPWIFQFSRIAWDPPVAAMYLTWGVYFFLRSRSVRSAAISGILFSLAAYTYPPMRAQVILLLPAVFFLQHMRRGLTLKSVITFFLALLLTSIPMIVVTLSGEIQGRFEMLSVFAPQVLLERFESSSKIYGIVLFIQNIFSHLSPKYLFLSGDNNLRHSTGSFGLLSWLEIFAIAGLVIRAIWTKGKILKFDSESKAAIALGLWGFMTGIAVASLTWESIPHSLRSIGGSPFLAIATGVLLNHVIGSSKKTASIAVLIATLFSFYFAKVYFTEYPKKVPHWYDVDVTNAGSRAAETGDWKTFLDSNQTYLHTGLRYQLLSKGNFSCEETFLLVPVPQ